jgi:iron complex transport system permease protein
VETQVITLPNPSSEGVKEAKSAAASLRFAIVVAALCVLLAVAIVVATAVGPIAIKPGSVLSILIATVFNRMHLQTGSVEGAIIFQIRLPRVVASALVGAALSMAGVLFQGLFRNPMADPYVIGSSGGAALGATIGLVWMPRLSVLGFSASAFFAFVASVLTMLLVYWLARVAGRTPIVTLLLAGLAVGTILNNSTAFVVMLRPESELAVRLLATWVHGAISITEWPQIGVIAVLIGIGTMASKPLARILNTLALGEDYAQQLGVRVEVARAMIILVGSLLTAAAVSLGGLIGFVGLVVPHFIRLLIGPDHIRLLPLSGLAGAIFLVLADTLARTAFAPSELPVGVLTAIVGGPAFLYLLRKGRREHLG